MCASALVSQIFILRIHHLIKLIRSDMKLSSQRVFMLINLTAIFFCVYKAWCITTHLEHHILIYILTFFILELMADLGLLKDELDSDILPENRTSSQLQPEQRKDDIDIIEISFLEDELDSDILPENRLCICETIYLLQNALNPNILPENRISPQY